MALIGNIESDYGVTLGYHHIKCYVWHKESQYEISVCSFKDEAARLAGKEPVIVQNYKFPTAASGKDITAVYNDLKTIAPFSTMISDI